MSKIDTPLSELITARTELIEEINKSLTDEDKNFLESFVKNEPNWSMVRDSKIKDFPSVKWKLYNQSKMNSGKQDEYLKKTLEVLNK